jgi:RNA recognition motif-containing protein
LFIGQVPIDFSETDLRPYFEPYGTVQSVHVVKGSDGKSKGCAMVTFTRWSDAEAALDKHNGTTILPGGRSRPLIVSFANPRRLPNGESEPGIAARKLFVGQAGVVVVVRSLSW